MKLPFWEAEEPSGAILGPALDNVLQELCDRRQTVLLATPYLHHESRFLERQGSELRVRATMSPEAVKHTLGRQPLRLRFPWALTFYSGPTRVLGYEREEGRRILRVQVPNHLVLDELRQAFRVERVGHSTGALGNEDGALLRVTLENISLQGAGVFCLESAAAEKLQAGRTVDLSLTLEQGFTLLTSARVCHSEGQALGLLFRPPLAGRNLQQLTEWLAPRTEEARKRWENRAELRARAELLAKPKVPPAGVLLISDDEDLFQEVASALEEVHAVRRTVAVMAPFKEATTEPPLLILVDATGLGMEGRYRVRTILETLALAAPVAVLGSVGDPQPGRLLAAELKAAAYIDWNPQQGLFFRRLAQGLIRHHWRSEHA